MHIGTSCLVVALAGLAMACGSSVEGGGGGGGGGSDAGGGDATTTASTTTGDGTGSTGSGGPYPLDCAAHERCSTSNACPGDLPESGCIDYPGCLTPICVSYEEAQEAYSSEFCDVLESAPAQMDIGCADATDGFDEASCDEVEEELARIQACTSDDECGQVLEGTGCGCTRSLVARLDASTEILEELTEASDGSCAPGSTCDCPEADGFACIEGACTWNYVDAP